MSAAPPMTPPPIEPVQPGLSEPARLINTFIAPSKTFLDLRRKASWWVPLLLISVMGIAFHVTVDKKVGFDQLARDIVAQSPQIQQQPPDQQQRTQSIIATSTKYGGYAFPLIAIIGALLVGTIMMLIFNFGMQAEISFGQSIAIMMYAWLPVIVRCVLGIVSLLVGNPDSFHLQNPVATNPAYFLDPATTSKFLYTFLMSFDVIKLWIVALVGLGFATNAKKKISPGTGIMVVGVCYFVWKLIVAGWAALRG
ncbi:MAG TPA: YIP1 family protein [Candidatus Angelobacter sp.]|nr:YIP1 family protein [Candidatus Angelobacter sp.]